MACKKATQLNPFGATLTRYDQTPRLSSSRTLGWALAAQLGIGRKHVLIMVFGHGSCTFHERVTAIAAKESNDDSPPAAAAGAEPLSPLALSKGNRPFRRRLEARSGQWSLKT
jgi:hypothetical protein